MSDEVDEPVVEENPLESWEDGSAFGVAKDKDPVCKTPVEEWIKNVEITSTADVPIPKNLVDQVIVHGLPTARHFPSITYIILLQRR